MRPFTRCSDQAADDDPAALSVRTVFARACDPESTPLPDALRSAIVAELNREDRGPRVSLTTTLDESAPPASLDLDPSVSAWAATQRSRFAALFATAEREGCADVLVRRATLACAPLASLSGAWLQWMSEPGNAEEAVTMRVLALYAGDVGVGHPRASRGSAYLTLMQHLRVAVHAHPASQLAQDRRIADQSFYLPAVALTMSRRPDVYRGEIIGLDLCLREAGMLPPLDGVQTRLPHAIGWGALDPSRARTPDGPPARMLGPWRPRSSNQPVRPARPRSSAASRGRSARCDVGATRCTRSWTPLATRLLRWRSWCGPGPERHPPITTGSACRAGR
jgi:hypothetical protein